MLRLPTVDATPRAINWDGLSKRYLNPGELEALVGLISTVPSPRRIVEFGVNEGRTAKAILREIPGIEDYIGVDVPQSYIPSKAAQRFEVPEVPGKVARDDKRFRLMLRDRGTLDVGSHEIAPADVVIIDGDHSAAVVRQDYALAKASVRPGGLVVFHDFNDLGDVDVREVVHELYDAGADLRHIKNTWWAFERV